MRISTYLTGLLAIGLVVAVEAQTAQTPKPRPRPRPTATHVVVRDVSGNPLSGVTVSVTGPAKAQATTGGDGAADLTLAAGSYRLRFEHDGFLPLERDVTVRAGQAGDLQVSLALAPPPPPPPPPPTPAPPPAPVAAARPAAPSGPPVTVSIPAFLDKNYVGRDPLKESVLACTPQATTRLLQLRDPIQEHKHADLDELLYIVAGDGAVKLGEQTTVVGPGSLTVVPRGVSHGFERRGKNPLIVLSMLAGAPCPPSVTAVTSTGR